MLELVEYGCRFGSWLVFGSEKMVLNLLGWSEEKGCEFGVWLVLKGICGFGLVLLNEGFCMFS